MQLKGSRTEANLMSAFSGEAQAHTKYIYYARHAIADGYEQLGDIFFETSKNELAHARLWFDYLHNDQGTLTVNANLEDAAKGENFEWTQMYKDYAQVARDEGFTEIANQMELISQIEKSHEERYRKFIFNLENGLVFSREGKVAWICRNCGHLHVAENAPLVCPVCKHPKAYFELQSQNY